MGHWIVEIIGIPKYDIIHSIFMRTGLKLYFAEPKLVYEPFGQINMHSTLDFCPRPARKKTNVPLHKRIARSLLS